MGEREPVVISVASRCSDSRRTANCGRRCRRGRPGCGCPHSAALSARPAVSVTDTRSIHVELSTREAAAWHGGAVIEIGATRGIVQHSHLAVRLPQDAGRTETAARHLDTARGLAGAPLAMILITPPKASDPYTADNGPRTISMRSMASVLRVVKSNDPPRLFVGSFPFTPSISTTVKFGSPPCIDRTDPSTGSA